MPAVIKIFQIVKFLRDFISSSISSLNISAFYMQVPYKLVPYKKEECKLRVKKLLGPPRGYGEQGNLQFLSMGKMETKANFLRELGNKVDSGDQFGISLRGTVKKHFWK